MKKAHGPKRLLPEREAQDRRSGPRRRRAIGWLAPDDVGLRRWAHALDPENLHQEILCWLDSRKTLLSVALGWHTKSSPTKEIPLDLLLCLLERLTIDSQKYPMAGGRYLAVPFGPREDSPYLTRATFLIERDRLVNGFVESSPLYIPQEERAEATPIIKDFQRKFFGWLLRPREPRDERALVRYKDISADIKGLSLPRSRLAFPQAVENLLDEDRKLNCDRGVYPVSRGWEFRKARPGERMKRVDPDRYTPSGFSYMLLGKEWRCAPAIAKKRVLRAERERTVGTAWASYDQWLTQQREQERALRERCRSALACLGPP